MSYVVELLDASENNIILPKTLRLTPKTCSKHAQLGFFDANIDVNGSGEDIFTCLGWLNYTVNIYAENDLIWSGFVNSATVRLGSITYEISLDSMYNSVSAIYTDENNAPVKTNFTQDDLSVDVFGIKQLVLSIDNASSTVVDSNIARILEDTKYPKAKFSTSPLSSGVASASINCLGRIQKSFWNYYERDFGLVENISQARATVKSGLAASGSMLFLEENSYFSDSSGDLINFDKDEKIRVSGTSFNDGTYTVFQGTNQEGETYEIDGDNSHFSGSTLTDDNGGLSIFDKYDYITISGTTSNDGLYIVDSVENNGETLNITSSFTSEDPVSSISVTKGTTIRLLNAGLSDEAVTATAKMFGISVAQSFVAPDDFDVKYLTVHASKIGSGGGNLRLSLYDGDGQPDTELGFTNISAGNISKNGGEVVGTLSPKISITEGSTYWIVAESQTTSSENYYEISVDEDLSFTSGGMLLGDGDGNWASRTILADLVFRVIAGEETTQQITTLLDSVESIQNSYVFDLSNLETSPYRAGDFLAYEELIELLNQGTDNDLRLLLIDDERGNVTVMEEDARPLHESSVEYFIDSEARVLSKNLSEVNNGFVIVGKWVGLRNFIPSGTNISFVTDPSPVFVEFIELNFEDGSYNIQSKTEQSLFNTRG